MSQIDSKGVLLGKEGAAGDVPNFDFARFHLTTTNLQLRLLASSLRLVRSSEFVFYENFALCDLCVSGLRNRRVTAAQGQNLSSDLEIHSPIDAPG